MGSTVPSTWNAQRLIDYARTFSWTVPILGVAGYSDQPALSFLDEIVKHILSKTNPWPWNAAKFPAFETMPYQQDYPTSISQNVLGWLQAAVICDINNTSPPQPIIPINAVNSLLPTMNTGRPQKVCWITNSTAQTAVWGRGRPNDPGPGSVYQDPLVLNGGGPGLNPLTAVTDTNGNIQLVTTYGECGETMPIWPVANSPAGTSTTDGTVVWQVQDPNGVALRLDALATYQSIVWEIRVMYQLKPPTISTLKQTIDPVPDDLSYLVRKGFLAYCTGQTDRTKFVAEFAQWQADIQEAMGSSDRSYSEYGFFPAAPISGGGGEGGSVGSWGYPGWVGWS